MSHVKQRSNKQGPMESNILVGQKLQLGPKAFKQGFRTKKIKLWFNLHGIILEVKPIGMDPKKKASRKAHGLENQCEN
jgi:hypothetical protein